MRFFTGLQILAVMRRTFFTADVTEDVLYFGLERRMFAAAIALSCAERLQYVAIASGCGEIALKRRPGVIEHPVEDFDGWRSTDGDA